MSSCTEPGFVEELDARRIRPSPRSLRSELRSLDELEASIARTGLLEPLVVRPLDDGSFEVVAGTRRLEACRRLRMMKIPCHIVDLTEREAYEASIVENLQRRTLEPIEEAQAFKNYVEVYGYGGASDLARRIGKSHSYVSRRIQLLDLPESVRDEVVRHRTTPSIAQELLALDGEDRERVAELIIEKKVTQREVRRMVRRVKDDVTGQFGPEDDLEEPADLLMEEQREHSLERALAKGITTLKLCMARLDDIYKTVDEDEWLVRETLMRHRWLIHGQVDELMHLRRRATRPPLH